MKSAVVDSTHINPFVISVLRSLDMSRNSRTTIPTESVVKKPLFSSLRLFEGRGKTNQPTCNCRNGKYHKGGKCRAPVVGRQNGKCGWCDCGHRDHSHHNEHRAEGGQNGRNQR